MTATERQLDALNNETIFQNTICERVDAWRQLPEYAEVTLVDWLLEAGIVAKPVPADQAVREATIDGYNGCYRQAIAALNYLAQYPRPDGGQSQFNAEHLLQIADEMKRSRSLTTEPKRS